MKALNIFPIAILSILLATSCQKEKQVTPTPKTPGNQTETLTVIGDDEDDEYIVIKPKPKSQQNGTPLYGATVELYNADFATSGSIDASGNLEFIAPDFGSYNYRVTLNNQVLLLKAVNITQSTTEIVDYL